MKTIWKFPVEATGQQVIRIPKGAQILTLQRQNEQPWLWAIVDPTVEQEERRFEIHGTGNPLPDEKGIERAYIGTFQQPPFVWHLFERLGV